MGGGAGVDAMIGVMTYAFERMLRDTKSVFSSEAQICRAMATFDESRCDDMLNL
jgi:hypothetical protein